MPFVAFILAIIAFNLSNPVAGILAAIAVAITVLVAAIYGISGPAEALSAAIPERGDRTSRR